MESAMLGVLGNDRVGFMGLELKKVHAFSDTFEALILDELLVVISGEASAHFHPRVFLKRDAPQPNAIT